MLRSLNTMQRKSLTALLSVSMLVTCFAGAPVASAATAAAPTAPAPAAAATATPPLVGPVLPPPPPSVGDGVGTITVSPSPLYASDAADLTFTYRATGPMTDGTLSIEVQPGFPAPTTGAGIGHVTASQGTVAASGQLITVSGLNLVSGNTVTVTYSKGPVNVAPDGYTFLTKQQADTTGVLTQLPTSPLVLVLAADGSGTLDVTPPRVAAGAVGINFTFTYVAPPRGLTDGSLELQVPSGWTAPSGAPGPGFVSAPGTVTIAGDTIHIDEILLDGFETIDINYTNVTVGAATGNITFPARQKTMASGTLTALGVSPSVSVTSATAAPDGTGTLTVLPGNYTPGETSGLNMTYTPPADGLYGGAVTVTVPADWTPPVANAPCMFCGPGGLPSPGMVITNTGSVSVSGQTITVDGLNLNPSQLLTIGYYGFTVGSTAGSISLPAKQKASAGGTLTALAVSPGVTVTVAHAAPDGGGTLTVSPGSFTPGQTGTDLTLTYTAPAGGIVSGDLAVTVPAGWTPPTTGGCPFPCFGGPPPLLIAGIVATDAGMLSIAGQTITVAGLRLEPGETTTINYRNVTVPAEAGSYSFPAQAKSTPTGTLTNLAASPVVNIPGADGGGTVSLSQTALSAGQSGADLTLTYTAPVGGLADGSLALDVPAGWTAPTADAGAGQVTASTGAVSVSGQTVTVSGITLPSAGTMTITYHGATVTGTPGSAPLAVRQSATAGGTLTPLAGGLNVTIYAPDGSGTLAVASDSLTAGQPAAALTFTYTAPAGGLRLGDLTVAVPAGWTAPIAANVTASTGTLSFAGQTITVAGITLDAGQTMTITYSNVTVGSTPGSISFAAQERSTAAGTLKALGASPSVTVADAPAPPVVTPPVVTPPVVTPPVVRPPAGNPPPASTPVVTPPPTPVVDPNTAQVTVQPDQAATATTNYLTVGLPAGVSADTLMVAVQQPGPSAAIRDASQVGSVAVLAEVNAFRQSDNSPVHQLQRKVTLTFRYDPAQVADPSLLQVYFFDSAIQTWVKLGGVVDATTHTITVAVDHFTLFAVLAPTAGPTPPAAPQPTPGPTPEPAPAPAPAPTPTPTTPTPAPAPLTDISGHWAEQAILRMAAQGVVSGYEDHSFRTESPVTRAEFAVMLARALKLAPATQPLSLTDAGAIPTWAQPQVAALVQAGIIHGRADGSFDAQANVTRAEVAVMLNAALHHLGRDAKPGTAAIADAGQIPAWAMDAIQTLTSLRLMVGYETGAFGPANPTTRAEAAALLDRMLSLK